MSHAISSEELMKAAEPSLEALAEETGISIDLVRTLYEEEVTLLSSQATITQFIGVIASQRVKRQLRSVEAH
jgi:hypothetical protein